jgi:hypothetical protein
MRRLFRLGARQVELRSTCRFLKERLLSTGLDG